MPIGDLGTERSGIKGIKRTISFGLYDDVKTWPTVKSSPTTYEDLGTLVTAVVMNTGTRMYEIQATLRKSSFGSKSGGARGSLVGITRLEIVRATMTPAVVGFIDQHKGEEMFFIVEDNEDRVIFVGEEDRPCEMVEFDLPLGADLTDEVDCKIVLEQVGPTPKFYGTASAPLTIPLTNAK